MIAQKPPERGRKSLGGPIPEAAPPDVHPRRLGPPEHREPNHPDVEHELFYVSEPHGTAELLV